MINEKELLNNLKQIHIFMCCRFRDICKEECAIHKDPLHFPLLGNKSNEYLQMCEDFEKFIKKYFGTYFNPNTNEWE